VKGQKQAYNALLQGATGGPQRPGGRKVTGTALAAALEVPVRAVRKAMKARLKTLAAAAEIYGALPLGGSHQQPRVCIILGSPTPRRPSSRSVRAPSAGFPACSNCEMCDS